MSLFLCICSQSVYQDISNFHLITEESLDDLNTRLDKPVTIRPFRPNLVIKGTKKPYIEVCIGLLSVSHFFILNKMRPFYKTYLRYQIIISSVVRSYNQRVDLSSFVRICIHIIRKLQMLYLNKSCKIFCSCFLMIFLFFVCLFLFY